MQITKADLKVEWFSGSGSGGQHRNKHQNCCRITHLATGVKTQSTKHKDRPSNQKEAFLNLVKLLRAKEEVQKARYNVPEERVRTYHAVRNEVRDEASGLKQSFSEVVEKPYIDDMIEARRKALTAE